MLDTSNTPSPLNTTPRPDELTSVRKLPVMFGQVPNITGSASFNSGSTGSMASSLRGGANGAFSSSEAVVNGYSPGSAQSSTYQTLKLSLQKANSSYAGNSVQPKALNALVCIKF